MPKVTSPDTVISTDGLTKHYGDVQAVDGLDLHVRRGEIYALGLTRALLLGSGTLCVALGILGMFLPVLPTTPFLLLAAVCYARSSKRFYDWLMTNRWCGAYVRNYREGRGITLRQKAVTISLLWVTIGYTVWVVLSLWWVKLILLGIAVGVTLHLIRIKTFTHPLSGSLSPGRERIGHERKVRRLVERNQA